jgi:uncharacterized protein YgbK (DUF1537 family)
VNGVPITDTEYASEHNKENSLVQEIIGNRPGIIVLDSETEADLLKIAQHYTNRVIVGSAGLAAAIAETMAKPNPVLSVLGSIRTVTQQQIKVLERRLHAKLFSLDTEAALIKKSQAPLIDQAVETIENGKDVILSSAPDLETVEKTNQIASSLKISSDQLEDHLVTALAEAARNIIESTQLSGLILSGGATAMAVCKALSIHEISIIEELRPGIPLIALDKINAVTKAGGLGEPDVLIQATQYLKRKYR